MHSAGEERFAKNPNQDKLAELETLKEFLEDAIKAVDEATQTIAAPAERLRMLLAAPDKKAALLELAGNHLAMLGLYSSRQYVSLCHR